MSKTKFISSLDQLPEGFVPLASLGCDRQLRHKLFQASRRGIVRAVKLVRSAGDLKTGRVFLHAEDFERYRERYEVEQQPKADRTQVEAEAVVEAAAVDVSLRAEIQSLKKSVDDLAAALELYVFSSKQETKA